ncbi:hypothetical protein GCM10027599_00870 [Yimella radicis]
MANQILAGLDDEDDAQLPPVKTWHLVGVESIGNARHPAGRIAEDQLRAQRSIQVIVRRTLFAPTDGPLNG